ncbi:MAG: DNA-binding protein YbiB [Rhodocyclaceae bacterium]|nr:DNA-binding protein YbiB [Rhodocyclaceae bacterium]
MPFASFIKEIGRGAKGARSLDRNRAGELFAAMLAGEVGELELGAALIALRIKSESLDELLGFADAMAARVATIAVPDGPRCVVLPTYNGARRQPNLMPLLALLLQRVGVPVLIQGRHDFDARIDPFTLLDALGIRRADDAGEASRRLADAGVAAIGVEALLPGLADLLATRPRLGVRSAGHTMAKLLDPCPGRTVRVVAVTHPEYLTRMEEFLRADGGHAQLLRGTEGEAYANPRRLPRLLGFADGRQFVQAEGEAGGAPPLAELPEHIDAERNADTIRRMLAGELPVPEPISVQAAALAALARES